MIIQRPREIERYTEVQLELMKPLEEASVLQNCASSNQIGGEIGTRFRRLPTIINGDSLILMIL